MNELKAIAISKAFVDSYHRKLLRSIEGDRPRLGPVFGGMLLSGRRVAELILEAR